MSLDLIARRSSRAPLVVVSFYTVITLLTRGGFISVVDDHPYHSHHPLRHHHLLSESFVSPTFITILHYRCSCCMLMMKLHFNLHTIKCRWIGNGRKGSSSSSPSFIADIFFMLAVTVFLKLISNSSPINILDLI